MLGVRLLRRGRVASNSLGNMTGVVLQSVMQLISVPVLIGLWDAHTYGLWLMLITIPTYFALTDFGYPQAALSDMTMAIGRGDRAQARRVFHSVTALMAASCLTLAVLAVAALLLPPLLFDLRGWWPSQPMLIALMVAYSALALFSRIPPVGFRSTGHYAFGTALNDGLAFVESGLVLAVAWFGGGPLQCAMALIAGRIVSTIVQVALLDRRVPWLGVGVADASLSELRRLFAPAVGAMAIPAGIAANLQGMVVVTGAILSPVAVATFVPVRTLVRLAIQAIGIVNRATMPEYSTAVAGGDQQRRSRLMRINLMLVAGILLPAALGFALFGPALVSLWTGGRIAPSGSFVAVMALGMLLHGLWYFASNLLLATNSHNGFAYMPLLASGMSLALAIGLGTKFGLTGIAVAVLAGELVNCLAILLAFQRHHRGVSHGGEQLLPG